VQLKKDFLALAVFSRVALELTLPPFPGPPYRSQPIIILCHFEMIMLASPQFPVTFVVPSHRSIARASRSNSFMSGMRCLFSIAIAMMAMDAAAHFANAQSTWSTAQLSVARTNIGATSVGNVALFAGGDSASGGAIGIDFFGAALLRYWVGPAAVFSLMCVNAGGVSDVVDVYHISAGTWSTAQLSVPRAAIQATSVGNVALFSGGKLASGGAIGIERFGAALLRYWVGPAAVFSLMCVSAGGVSDVVDVYHISAGTWSTAQLSVPRMSHAATSVGNVALFAGGYASGVMPISPSKTVDLYNYSTSKWSTAVISLPRFVFAATSVGNVALFAGGYGGDSVGA
jgi:hypothetical protein